MRQHWPGSDEKGDGGEDASDAKHAEDGADGHEGGGRLAAAVPVERLPVDAALRLGFAARNVWAGRRVLGGDAGDLVDGDGDDDGRGGENDEAETEYDRGGGGRCKARYLHVDS